MIKPKQLNGNMIGNDISLIPFKNDIVLRVEKETLLRKTLLGTGADISSFANGYMYYGFHRTDFGWVFREWLPGADSVYLTGDFNANSPVSHPLTKLDNGIWEISLTGKDSLSCGQHVRLLVRKGNSSFYRIPAYIRRTAIENDTVFGIVTDSTDTFAWTDGGYKKRKCTRPVIYKVHVGMSSEKAASGTYRSFADERLIAIAEGGYNTLLLTDIHERRGHLYSEKCVASFFAPSEEFGTIEDLKYLIDRAHALNLFVLIEIVHFQASGEIGCGLNMMDGTSDQYFLAGERGTINAGNTKAFNYGKHDVIHFLLSNLKYWLEVYHFDGVYFDNVTSMLYHDHGASHDFKEFDQYFSMNTNIEAVTYLQLANIMIHAVNPFAITIAEERSNMPGLCKSVRNGGLGFDYRLSEASSVFLSDKPGTRSIDVDMLWSCITERHPGERRVSRCEKDVSIMYCLADSEMYTGMKLDYHTDRIDRAFSLTKLLRFISFAVGGDGYMSYMGNEFGHPDPIVDPAETDAKKNMYTKRQWHLADDTNLKYSKLKRFDVEMLRFGRKYRIPSKHPVAKMDTSHLGNLLLFRICDLLFAFNFEDFPVESKSVVLEGCRESTFRCIFSSEYIFFGGDNLEASIIPGIEPDSFLLSIPARSAFVFTIQ